VDGDDKAGAKTEAQNQYLYTIELLCEKGMRTEPHSTRDMSVIMAARVLSAPDSKGWYLYEVLAF
jgi:hypothetical protein